MIRTKEKEKLPKGFSYPLGAEKVSEVLGEIPQLEFSGLRFNWRDEFWKLKWQKRIRELGVLTLIRAQYQPLWDELWIFVYSVPSEYSEAARELLVGGELQMLSQQLKQSDLKLNGFDKSIKFSLAAHCGR